MSRSSRSCSSCTWRAGPPRRPCHRQGRGWGHRCQPCRRRRLGRPPRSVCRRGSRIASASRRPWPARTCASDASASSVAASASTGTTSGAAASWDRGRRPARRSRTSVATEEGASPSATACAASARRPCARVESIGRPPSWGPARRRGRAPADSAPTAGRRSSRGTTSFPCRRRRRRRPTSSICPPPSHPFCRSNSRCRRSPRRRRAASIFPPSSSPFRRNPLRCHPSNANRRRRWRHPRPSTWGCSSTRPPAGPRRRPRNPSGVSSRRRRPRSP
mmetsp:Transcript_29957/g.63564  ORF Transcript_29957/g.63564 Transcript_29957/m.63564 type:complete len:275 (-) Transcript_29957:37-861(-)